VNEIREVDGNRFASLDGFYDEVSRVLIPGAKWGRNLDALNDILRGGFGTPKRRYTLSWRSSAKSRHDLGYPETVRVLERRLAECHAQNRSDVSRQLEAARKGEGPTVFDWLLELIGTHSDITLELK